MLEFGTIKKASADSFSNFDFCVCFIFVVRCDVYKCTVCTKCNRLTISLMCVKMRSNHLNVNKMHVCVWWCVIDIYVVDGKRECKQSLNVYFCNRTTHIGTTCLRVLQTAKCTRINKTAPTQKSVIVIVFVQKYNCVDDRYESFSKEFLKKAPIGDGWRRPWIGFLSGKISSLRCCVHWA